MVTPPGRLQPAPGHRRPSAAVQTANDLMQRRSRVWQMRTVGSRQSLDPGLLGGSHR